MDELRAREIHRVGRVGDSQQQIYTFTGAINALAQVGAEQRTFLTKSFRFGPKIAEVANDVLDLLPDGAYVLNAARGGVGHLGGGEDGTPGECGLDTTLACDAALLQRPDNRPGMAYALVLRRLLRGEPDAAPGAAPAEERQHG